MDLNKEIMNMMLDMEVPLGSILDLCPQFKKKVLKGWMARKTRRN